MRIAICGDVMLGRLVNLVLKREHPGYPWGDTLPVFRDADLRLCNLECVISDRGAPWGITPKVFHFRTDARNVAVLEAAGMSAVSLANNHILDFEYEALLETLEILDKVGIAHAGAGRSVDDAMRPAIVQTTGGSAGLIAFTDNEPGWEATATRPGTFFVPVHLQDRRAARLLDLVAGVKKTVDHLTVSAHWGPNWGCSPPEEHPPFARAVIDAGADLFFGHSGHVFRGIEIHEGRPIIYCAGDFVDDYAVDEIERNDESFVFVLDTAERRLLLYPTLIRNFQAHRAYGREAENIVAKMRALCQALGSDLVWDPRNNVATLPVFSCSEQTRGRRPRGSASARMPRKRTAPAKP